MIMSSVSSISRGGHSHSVSEVNHWNNLARKLITACDTGRVRRAQGDRDRSHDSSTDAVQRYPLLIPRPITRDSEASNQ